MLGDQGQGEETTRPRLRSEPGGDPPSDPWTATMPASRGTASRRRAPMGVKGMSFKTSRPSTVEEPHRSAAPRASAAAISSAEPGLVRTQISEGDQVRPNIATAKGRCAHPSLSRARWPPARWRRVAESSATGSPR